MSANQKANYRSINKIDVSIHFILQKANSQIQLYKNNGSKEQFGKKAPKTQENSNHIGKVELNDKHDS